MTDLGASAASILTMVLLVLAWAIRPTHAHCPDRYGLRMGVRIDGHFQCWPAPVGDEDWSFATGRPDRSVQPAEILESRIYCTGGATPHQDGTSVWCQR